MSNLDREDLLLVERAGESFNMAIEDESNLDDDDLLWVHRPGVGDFSIKGKDISLKPDEAPVATGSISYDNVTNNRFTEEEFTITAGAQGGAGAVSTEIKPYVVGLLDNNIKMHGLRFDRNRETYFNQTLPSVNDRTFTFSCWIKRPLNNGENGLESTVLSADPDNQTKIYFNNNDRIFLTQAGATLWNSNPILKDNEWFHLCMIFDSEEVAGADRCKVYVNGEQIAYDNINVPQDQNVSFGRNVEYFLGTSMTGRAFDGYLSDCYFLGRTGDVNYFGHTVDGIWSPLPSDTVKQNIAYKESPADTVPNYAEKWSDQSTFSTNNTNSNLFDGDTDSYALCNDFQFRTLTPKTFTTAGKIELFTNIALGETLTIRLNGSDTYVSDPMPNGPNRYLSVAVPAGTYTTIEVKCVTVSPSYSISSVRIDNRVLIDGPADTSQVWSDYLTDSSGAWLDSYGPDKAFDGQTGVENTARPSVIDTNSTFSPPGGISYSGSVEVWTYYTGTVQLNSESAVAVSDANDWTTIATGAGTLDTLTFVSSSARVFLGGIRIDGKVLIDGAPAWNTSEVWSDNCVSPQGGGYPFADAFDGDLSTFAGSVSLTTGTFTHTTLEPVPCTKLRVQTRLNANGTGTIESGGKTIDITPDDGPSQWYEFPDPPADYTGLAATVTSTNGAGAGIYIHAVEVNGRVLVDANSFCDNGFYLPFDPAAEGLAGQTWSDNVTQTGTWVGGRPVANIFSGELDNSNSDVPGVNSSNSGSLVFDPPITGSVIEINGASVTNEVTINGDSNNKIKLTDNSLTGTIWNDTKVTSLSRLDLTSTNTYATYIRAIRVDGRVLIDGVSYSGLGNDDSGENNHFDAHNFVVATSGFKPVTYTGNSGNQTIITNTAPDLVWIKKRSGDQDYFAFDSVRGKESELYPNQNYLAGTTTRMGDFLDNGFVITDTDMNNSNETYVAWTWSASDTTVSNTDGSIDSQVRAGNGFSVVTYNGQNSTGTVGHGLDKPPEFMIVKCVTGTDDDWQIYHSSLGPDYRIRLNKGNGAGEQNIWDNTAPTSKVFTVHSGWNSTNKEGASHVAYCWSEIKGQSSIGSYIGNGNASSRVIECGFKPAFILIKDTADAKAWFLYDTARDEDNPMQFKLSTNTSAKENDPGSIGTADACNINSVDNGFELITTGPQVNEDGREFIYIAFADDTWTSIDTVLDTPVKDYAVIQGGSDVSVVNGSLDVTYTTSGSQRMSFSTKTCDKYSKTYVEYTAKATDGNMLVGVTKSTTQTEYLGQNGDQWAYNSADGKVFNNGSSSPFGGTWKAGDIIGILVDNTGEGADRTKVSMFVNGVSQGVLIQGSNIRDWYLAAGNNRQSYSWNFGQQPFVYPQEGAVGLFVEGSTDNEMSTQRLYCVLDGDLNITDLQEADPGFRLASSPATVTFPSTFPTGNTPDKDLPNGSSFGSEIKVSNTAGSDQKTLPQITP